MIKVGFILVDVGWTGGINYYKNLFFALSKHPNGNIKIVVFVGKKTKEKQIYGKYAKIVEKSFFDFNSVENIFGRVCNKLFRDPNWCLRKILKKYKIDIVSHSPLPEIKGVKTLSWIPDFQHIHLPEFFTKEELKARDDIFILQAQKSDGLILSSFDALNDLKKFLNGRISVPTFVLQFVSQPNEQYFNLTENDKGDLLKKYNLPNVFFYVPNQMWAHKNHIVLFEAVKILKEKGISICVVCTGNMADYRNEKHIQEICDFVSGNRLKENIKLLGLVDYCDVFALIKFSKAVINPSLFEGWSSTVEECKSVKKKMILSDLDVHKEQYPNAVFFERENSEDLSEKLEKYDEISVDSTPFFDVEKATEKFARTYWNIVKNI